MARVTQAFRLASALLSSRLGISPKPAVRLFRSAPDLSGLGPALSARDFADGTVRADLDVVYAPGDPDGILDLFRPAAPDGPLPTVVWVHGGGFIAGEKSALRDYLSLLAAHGFTVANVEYTYAPEATYPTPIRQVNAAIAHLVDHARRYGVDPDRIILAGDSAGAHIAAQAAMAIAQPAYAAEAQLPAAIAPHQLIGTVLFSGPFDPSALDYSSKAFGFFMRTVLWAYSGSRDFQSTDAFRYASLPAFVTSDYPPTLVSTGPADPLLAQNRQWVAALEAAGVDVTPLFFDEPGTTAGHEYQLDLHSPEGRIAFRTVVDFLRRVSRTAVHEGPADRLGWETPPPRRSS